MDIRNELNVTTSYSRFSKIFSEFAVFAENENHIISNLIVSLVNFNKTLKVDKYYNFVTRTLKYGEICLKQHNARKIFRVVLPKIMKFPGFLNVCVIIQPTVFFVMNC